MTIMALLFGFHILSVAVFLGGNVLMEFVVMRRMAAIPPGDAAVLGNKVGSDFAYLTWGALVGIAVTGVLILWQLNLLWSLFDPGFMSTRYGLVLLVKILIFVTLVASGTVITFYLRPRVVQKLPYNAESVDIDRASSRAMANAIWLQRCARYNMVASVIGLFAGAFLANGFP
jgi:uncharacterized membrane protein